MSRLAHGWLATALLLLAFPIGAANVPARMEIKYRVLLGAFSIGEGSDVFEHDGKTYRLRSESKTAGLAALIYRLNITRVSTGSITDKGLRPDSYEETRNGKPKRSVRFDWEAKRAQLTDGDNKQTVELPENTWDMASFGYNFAFFSPTGEEMNLFLTDGRRVSPYKYAILGKERIETELGTIETVHVKKVRRPNDPREFDVWLSPSQHYAPVRIRFTEKDGTTFDSVVTKITFSDR
jgi:hypothetical protein